MNNLIFFVILSRFRFENHCYFWLKFSFEVRFLLLSSSFVSAGPLSDVVSSGVRMIQRWEKNKSSFEVAANYVSDVTLF